MIHINNLKLQKQKTKLWPRASKPTPQDIQIPGLISCFRDGRIELAAGDEITFGLESIASLSSRVVSG